MRSVVQGETIHVSSFEKAKNIFEQWGNERLEYE